MPTKIQAKAAVDAAAVDVKADIDNILPVGVDISDGGITFNPTGWTIKMNAGASVSTAKSWITTILTNLVAASREIRPPLNFTGIPNASTDPLFFYDASRRMFRIISPPAVYTIINF